MSSVRPATAGDIPELVRLREVLFSELGPSRGRMPAGDSWRTACAAVLEEQLSADTTRILVVDEDAGLASCGIGVIDRRLPNPFNPAGVVGHIFGIATDPAYRRRGQHLYRSLGFQDPAEPMLTWKAS